MQCISDFQKEHDRLPIVCEIGSAEGNGVARYAGFCDTVIAIDAMVSGRPDIVSYEKEDMNVDQAKVDRFKKNMSFVDLNVELVIGSSQWKETVDRVKDILDDRTIDILLVDGTHHPAEAVYKDFELYKDLVTSKGYAVFDDTYEPAVLEAFDKAKELDEWELHEEWEVRRPDILQALKVLKKK